MKTIQSGTWIAWIGLALIVAMGCEDYNLPRLDAPVLRIESVREDGLFVEVSSRIDGVERQTVRRYGLLWSRAEEELTLDNFEGIDTRESLSPDEAPTSFTSRIRRTDLQPNTPYFLRAFAVTDQRICYSEPILYANLNVQVQTGAVSYAGGSQARINGAIRISQTGIRLLAYGHCWTSEARLPTVDQDRSTRFEGQLAAEIPVASILPDLTNGQTYAIRAYATIETPQGDVVTIYGELISYSAELTNFWSSLLVSGGPTPREGAISFTIGTTAYLAGGIRYDSLGRVSVFDDCWRFSASTGWRPCRSLPAPVAYGVAFTLDDSAYLGAGFQATAVSGQDSVLASGRFFAYDPVADQWEETAPLPTVMAYGIAFTYEGKGYAGLGVANDDIWQFDPSDPTTPWTRYQSGFPGRDKEGVVALTLGGEVYVGGGASRQFWRFRGSDGWEAGPVFPGPARTLAVSVSSDTGKGYYALGLDEASNVLRDVWVFDPAQADPAMVWQELPELPAAGRIFASGFALDGQLYLGLGSASTVQSRGDFWVFSP